MALLAIMSALVAPQLAGFGNGQKMDNAAAEIRAAVSEARGETIASAMPHRLELTPDGYHVLRRTGQTFEVVPGSETVVPNLVSIRLSSPDGQMLQAIEFSPDGRSTPVVIEITGTDGRSVVYEARGVGDPLRRVDPSERAVR